MSTIKFLIQSGFAAAAGSVCAMSITVNKPEIAGVSAGMSIFVGLLAVYEANLATRPTPIPQYHEPPPPGG